MPIPVRVLTSKGELVPAPFTAESLDDVASCEPDGIYTITRTFDSNHMVMLNAHMDRLEQSARLEGIPLKLDRALLRTGLRNIIHLAGFTESRFRITIPRLQPDTALLAVEPLNLIPEEIRMAGVAVATKCIDRPNPQAKSNRWIQQRDQARKELPHWAYEGLVCTTDGLILEGFTSNFYSVQAGKLHTAREFVLSGIARTILLQVAEDLIQVVYEPIHRDVIHSLDEAILTSSSRGVVPIVQIDEHVIGRGEPGPVTLELWQRYQNWVAAHLEEI